jgi:hypothetical protein
VFQRLCCLPLEPSPICSKILMNVCGKTPACSSTSHCPRLLRFHAHMLALQIKLNPSPLSSMHATSIWHRCHGVLKLRMTCNELPPETEMNWSIDAGKRRYSEQSQCPNEPLVDNCEHSTKGIKSGGVGANGWGLFEAVRAWMSGPQSAAESPESRQQHAFQEVRELVFSVGNKDQVQIQGC